jgi:hypothetical protein
MINPKDIRLSQIKDLKALFFYPVENSYNKDDKLYLGLKITYGDKQSLAYDYKSDVWNEFVSKVIMTYKKEKDDRNIILLGPFTEDIIKSTDIAKFTCEVEDNNCQQDPISVTNSRNFQVQMIKDYLKNVSNTIISLFHTEGSFEIKDIIGYRDRYIVKYVVDGKEKMFPMIIIRTIEDHFTFQIGMIEGENFHITGDIDLGNDYVNIVWKDPRYSLIGKHIYNSKGEANEETILSGGKIIYYNQSDSKITQDDMEKINFYLNIAGLDTVSEGFKTVKNNYIMSDIHYEDASEDNKIFMKKSCHIKFDGDYVHLIYKNTTGLSKYDNRLSVPIFEEAQEILFIPFEIENKQYVLMQKAWIPRDVTRGDYKEMLLNRYYYSVFEIEQCCNWVNGFIPCDSFKVAETVDTMDELISYVMKRKSVK